MQNIRKQPILFLIVINIAIGLVTFRSYGLSWDEPLFYEYGEASLYAYDPRNWFSGDFDLTKSFGASASDHANRGPAYLILVSPIQRLLEGLGLDSASAWHLINFLTFNLGVYLLYRLASKWMSRESALITAAFFTFQPLLWGHAFINPKDIPFLTFFLGSVVFGFEMIDDLSVNPKPKLNNILIASLFLGIATSIRVLGPYAAILIILYGIAKRINSKKMLTSIWLYAAFSVIIAFALWPYLWVNPLQKFIEVFIFMSDNPTQLNVLFAGKNYQAGEIPRTYFPILLSYTLTEPTYILILTGMILGFWNSDFQKRLILSILLIWFGTLAGYILVKRPAMYDGYRHFLFILPPLFIFCGLAFDFLFKRLNQYWKKSLLVFFTLFFGIAPIIQLHPYQYAYYNNIAGGVGGVFRKYETEYWLTCYREAVLELNQSVEKHARLFVRREPHIAAYYAGANIAIHDFRSELKDITSGDYYLVNTRSNEDLKFIQDEPILIEISRMGATFCLIKQVP